MSSKNNIPLDNDGQPVITRFNTSRNKDKALYGLKGILLGVTANNHLSEQELLFLYAWLRSQQPLKKDSDVIDLLKLIGEILDDGRIAEDELTELHEMIENIIDYKALPICQIESQINELSGLITGIAADNLAEDSEIIKLEQWLTTHADIAGTWPASELIKRVTAILEDGIITADERQDMLETIKQITGTRFDETGLAHGAATEFLEDDVELVEHDGHSFCFTGAFVAGTRKTIEAAAQDKGAVTTRSPTKSTDYLVIGTLASRDWRFTSHGRKIEKALKIKEDGGVIFIITERTWLKYIDS